MILASVRDHPCELEKQHTPVPRYSEFHHIVPVAWQLHTPNPTSRPSPGKDPEGRGMLWDDRGAWACRTSHGNVHYWIVALTHAFVEDPAAAIVGAWARAVPTAYKRSPAAIMARMGLDRAASCSVDFVALGQLGEWGQV